jgi:hypothetical protein
MFVAMEYLQELSLLAVGTVQGADCRVPALVTLWRTLDVPPYLAPVMTAGLRIPPVLVTLLLHLCNIIATPL